jgi:hypothetical protein
VWIFLDNYKKIKDGEENNAHYLPFGFLPPFGLHAIESPPAVFIVISMIKKTLK